MRSDGVLQESHERSLAVCSIGQKGHRLVPALFVRLVDPDVDGAICRLSLPRPQQPVDQIAGRGRNADRQYRIGAYVITRLFHCAHARMPELLTFYAECCRGVGCSVGGSENAAMCAR